MSKTILRLILPIFCLSAFAGCSEILPGLNIHLPSAPQTDYKIVRDQSGKYQVRSTQPENIHARYRLLPITPELIAAERRADRQNINQQLPMLRPGAVPPEYRIGPGDVLNIIVLDHPELGTLTSTLSIDPKTYGTLVSSSGEIYFPYAGTFKISGMTAMQARSYLTKKLSENIAHPQIKLRIISYQADRIEVTGEVAKPGTITLNNEPQGVLQAIDASGGLTTVASRRRAILVRDGKRYDVDLANLLSGDRVVPNPVLEPGDFIHIPDQSGDQVFLLGAVTKQQSIVLQQNPLTLLQALTEAGGLNITSANDAGVLVFRLGRQPGALPSVFTLDLSKPANVFLAGEFRLRPRDVVYVKATALSQYNAVINQLLPTVTTVFELNQLTK